MIKDFFHLFSRKIRRLTLYRLGKPELTQIDHRQFKFKYFVSDLIVRPTSTFLIKYFAGNLGHEVDLSRGHLGFGMLHYAFITTLRPKRILCIGSQKGFIPAICAMACKDNNFGRVDFVDAGKDKNDPNSWGGIGFWKKFNPNEHFSPFNLNKFITTYVMTSAEFAAKYKNRRYGYIYIDGDHSFSGVSRDYSTFWPRLKRDGMMCFHDITLKGKAGNGEYGVWKLWKQLETKHNHKISIILRQNGIGILQKND